MKTHWKNVIPLFINFINHFECLHLHLRAVLEPQLSSETKQVNATHVQALSTISRGSVMSQSTI